VDTGQLIIEIEQSMKDICYKNIVLTLENLADVCRQPFSTLKNLADICRQPSSTWKNLADVCRQTFSIWKNLADVCRQPSSTWKNLADSFSAGFQFFGTASSGNFNLPTHREAMFKLDK
jgi:hypothetical protein